MLEIMPKKSTSTQTQTSLPLVVNLTPWQFPTDLYEHVRNDVRVNPQIWVFPGVVRHFIANHFPIAHDMLRLDGFADENGQIVLFWEEDWTEDYARWVLCHEMFHTSQYFDKGNMMGSRWDGLSEADKEKAWEKEACDYANMITGKKIDKDFKRYKSQPDKPVKKAAKKKARKTS